MALATGKQRARRKTFVDEVIAIIPAITYDTAVAEAHAELLIAVRRQGVPRGAHDLIIAATARASGRAVMTADARAFHDLPGVAFQRHR